MGANPKASTELPPPAKLDQYSFGEYIVLVAYMPHRLILSSGRMSEKRPFEARSLARKRPYLAFLRRAGHIMVGPLLGLGCLGTSFSRSRPSRA